MSADLSTGFIDVAGEAGEEEAALAEEEALVEERSRFPVRLLESFVLA